MGTRRRMLAVGAIVVAATLGFSVYAYTASNTVPGSSAGDGSGVVSGYAVSAISYTLNGSTPSNIDTVSFTIVPATAGTTKAKMDNNWYSCSNAAGSITCDTDATPGPQLTVTPLDSLEALVVQ